MSLLMLWSLPSRERGLKSEDEPGRVGPILSLPSRERGLKLMSTALGVAPDRSLPSRERGLKFRNHPYADYTLGRSLHGSVD